MQNEQAQALRMSAATLKKEIGKFNKPSALFCLFPVSSHLYKTHRILFTQIYLQKLNLIKRKKGRLRTKRASSKQPTIADQRSLFFINPVSANKHTYFLRYFCCILFRYVAETVRSTYKWVTETFSDTLLCLRVKAHDCCGGDDRRRGTT